MGNRTTKVKTHLDCSEKEDRLAREAALTTKGLAECYTSAGYTTKCKEPRKEAYKVLVRPHVAQRVDYYRSMADAKLDIRVDRLMAEFAAIAFLDPIDVFEVTDNGALIVRSLADMPPWARRAIMSIKQTTRVLPGDDEIREDMLEIRFHPKVAALSKIAEIKNMFEDNNKAKAPHVHIDLTFEGAR